MALSPSMIAEELQKIPRFEVAGTITSSKLVSKDNECLHSYESTLDTGAEEVVFSYSVLAAQCITDGVFEIEQKPFSKNTEVTLSLTQSVPHRLVASDVRDVPPITTSSTVYAMSAVVLLLLVSAVILAVIKKRQIKESIRQ